MSIFHIMLASFLGNIPGCAIYSYIGASLESLIDVDIEIPLKLRLGYGLIGGSSCLLIATYVGLLGRAALRTAVGEEILDEERELLNGSNRLSDSFASCPSENDTVDNADEAQNENLKFFAHNNVTRENLNNEELESSIQINRGEDIEVYRTHRPIILLDVEKKLLLSLTILVAVFVIFGLVLLFV